MANIGKNMQQQARKNTKATKTQMNQQERDSPITESAIYHINRSSLPDIEHAPGLYCNPAASTKY